MQKRYAVMWVTAILTLSPLFGCGSSDKPPDPGAPLTEQQKQQLKELNQQRQDEWKSTKK